MLSRILHLLYHLIPYGLTLTTQQALTINYRMHIKRGVYLAFLCVSQLVMTLDQAGSANFIRFGPQRLDFLDIRSELTIAPPVKVRGNGFATHVAAYLASSAKFRTFTSRARWRAPF